MEVLAPSTNAVTQMNGITTATSITPRKKDTGNDPKDNLW